MPNASPLGPTHMHVYEARCVTTASQQRVRKHAPRRPGALEVTDAREDALHAHRLPWGMASGALEQERQQLLRELEDMHRDHGRAGDNDDHVGQSKHLMDLAAMELSKLKVSSSSSSSSSLSPPAGSSHGFTSLGWGFRRMPLRLWTHAALLR